MNTAPNKYTRTFNGTKFYPLDPRVADINIYDIAHALACNNRYNGHLPVPYSVGQHSVLVSYQCEPENALWGLLHDAYEAYLPDMPSPVKHDPRFRFYRMAEAKGMLAVCEKFDLPPAEPQDVWIADKRAYLTEIRDLRGRELTRDGHIKHEKWHRDLKPFDEVIEPWGWIRAKRRFLERFNQLTKDRA